VTGIDDGESTVRKVLASKGERAALLQLHLRLAPSFRNRSNAKNRYFLTV